MRRNIQLHVYGDQNQVMIGLDHSTNFPHQTIEGDQKILNRSSSNDIIILQNPSGFQPFYHLFRKHIQDHLPLTHPLQHLLLLADRVLIYVQHEDSKEELRSLPKQLQQIQENKLTDSNSESEHFLRRAAKQWLETIHALLFPEKWKNDKEDIGEKQIWNDLGLLSNHTDLDIENLSLFEASLQDQSPTTNPCTHLLCLLVYTLDKHYDSLRNTLRNVVLLQEPIKDHPYFQILKEERELHLQKYVDRFEPLHIVKKILNHTQGEYLLLTGKAGIGKTAFISKLSQELADSSNPVNSNVPWLPKIILHYCKQLKTPKEVLQAWLLQANLLLVNKINLPHFGFNQNTQDAYQMIRNAIYQILHQLTLECGEIIFLIDALDELTLPSGALDFLPQTIPDQAKVIISARKDSQTMNWLINNRKTIPLELFPLRRDEIPRFTNLDDETAKEFHDNLWKKSKGWTLYIASAAQELRDHGGDPNKVKVHHVNHFYEQQLNKWTSLDHKKNNQILREILGLLVIFEAARPLTLADIQSYLRSLNYEVKKQELKSLLSHVGDQVSGIQSDILILQINSFAEYIRNKCWTKHEHKEFLRKIINWLGTDLDIPIETSAQMISNYLFAQDHSLFLDQLIDLLAKNNMERLFQIGLYIYLFNRWNPNILKFIKIPAEHGHLKAIYLMSQIPFANVNKSMWEKKLKKRLKREKLTLDQLFKNDPIIDNYYKVYYMNYHYPLLKIAIKDSRIVGQLLDLFVYDLRKWYRDDDAIALLREAAKRDESFNRQLGMLLVETGKNKDQIQEGLELLKKVASTGDIDIMQYLGEYLIKSNYVSNISEGLNWLQRAAIAGNSNAMYCLGIYLIEGEEVPQNIDEGIQWLFKAADAGKKYAVRSLGRYLIKAKYFTSKHAKVALKWLHKAANSGNIHAMYYLGVSLIIGKHSLMNIREGIQWLHKAAQAGYKLAQEVLKSRPIKKYQKLEEKLTKGNKWAICKFLFLLIEHYFSYEQYTALKNQVIYYKNRLPWFCYLYLRLRLYMQKIYNIKPFYKKFSYTDALLYKIHLIIRFAIYGTLSLFAVLFTRFFISTLFPALNIETYHIIYLHLSLLIFYLGFTIHISSQHESLKDKLDEIEIFFYNS